MDDQCSTSDRAKRSSAAKDCRELAFHYCDLHRATARAIRPTPSPHRVHFRYWKLAHSESHSTRPTPADGSRSTLQIRIAPQQVQIRTPKICTGLAFNVQNSLSATTRATQISLSVQTRAAPRRQKLITSFRCSKLAPARSESSLRCPKSAEGPLAMFKVCTAPQAERSEQSKVRRGSEGSLSKLQTKRRAPATCSTHQSLHKVGFDGKNSRHATVRHTAPQRERTQNKRDKRRQHGLNSLPSLPSLGTISFLPSLPSLTSLLSLFSLLSLHSETERRAERGERGVSLSPCLSLPLSLSLSPSLPRSLSPSLPLSLSPSVPLSLAPLSPSLPLSLSPSLPRSLSPSLSPPVCSRMSLFLSFFLYFFLSFFLSF